MFVKRVIFCNFKILKATIAGDHIEDFQMYLETSEENIEILKYLFSVEYIQCLARLRKPKP